MIAYIGRDINAIIWIASVNGWNVSIHSRSCKCHWLYTRMVKKQNDTKNQEKCQLKRWFPCITVFGLIFHYFLSLNDKWALLKRPLQEWAIVRALEHVLGSIIYNCKAISVLFLPVSKEIKNIFGLETHNLRMNGIQRTQMNKKNSFSMEYAIGKAIQQATVPKHNAS